MKGLKLSLYLVDMVDSRFLEKNKIHNFDLILDFILNGDKIHDRLAIENIGDILACLDYNDKKRDMQEPELKRAAFTVIKAMLDTGMVEISWPYGWASSKYDSPPKNNEEIFDILDRYWYEDDGFGLDKTYLLFFTKKRK
jgi:hypothetical protein